MSALNTAGLLTLLIGQTYRQIGGSIARIVNFVEDGSGGTTIRGSSAESIGISVMPHLISCFPGAGSAGMTTADGEADGLNSRL